MRLLSNKQETGESVEHRVLYQRSSVSKQSVEEYGK